MAYRLFGKQAYLGKKLRRVLVVFTHTKERLPVVHQVARTRLGITAVLQAHGVHGRVALAEPLGMLALAVRVVTVALQRALLVAAETVAVAVAVAEPLT